ncbi:hypothetical protein ACLKA6_001599 [Drosophila palustris]
MKDAYPLPCIEGILSRIEETHFISSVDLKFAFWQIELEEKSRAYTAFTVPGRPLYQFRHMPFGLCNAAQQLCRLMDKVIPTTLRSNVFVYLDDLLIISADFPTHMKYLRSVEELEVTPEDLLGFETLEFESTAYQELVNEVISQEQR